MELVDKYRLNPNTTESELRNEGFRHNVFRCYVYSSMIQLVVYVDLSEEWWSYQVCNNNSDSLYIPYYDRRYGLNEIVKELDRKIEEIIEEMVKRGILIKVAE